MTPETTSTLPPVARRSTFAFAQAPLPFRWWLHSKMPVAFIGSSSSSAARCASKEKVMPSPYERYSLALPVSAAASRPLSPGGQGSGGAGRDSDGEQQRGAE